MHCCAQQAICGTSVRQKVHHSRSPYKTCRSCVMTSTAPLTVSLTIWNACSLTLHTPLKCLLMLTRLECEPLPVGLATLPRTTSSEPSSPEQSARRFEHHRNRQVQFTGFRMGFTQLSQGNYLLSCGGGHGIRGCMFGWPAPWSSHAQRG